jgi:hypothetical protein
VGWDTVCPIIPGAANNPTDHNEWKILALDKAKKYKFDKSRPGGKMGKQAFIL